MTKRTFVIYICLLFTVAISCSKSSSTKDESDSGSGEYDASKTEDTGTESTICTEDSDCSDGLFCNGEEECSPEVDGANDKGCVAGTPPCGAGECDEAEDECTNCDVDEDGYNAIVCGGKDCDDEVIETHPGQIDICDTIDNDCDGETDEDIPCDLSINVTIEIDGGEVGQEVDGNIVLGVDIPENAVDEDTEITIRLVDPPVSLPENCTAVGPTYEFSPHNQSFSEPIIIRLPAISSFVDLRALYLEDNDATEWAELEITDSEGGATQVEVESLGYYQVAICEEEDIDAGVDGGMDAEVSDAGTDADIEISTDGLVAYYPFNGNARDESGNYNDCNTIGKVIPTEDRKGNSDSAYYFNGSSHLECGNDESLRITGELTLAAWFKAEANTLSGGNRALVSKWEYPDLKSYVLALQNQDQSSRGLCTTSDGVLFSLSDDGEASRSNSTVCDPDEIEPNRWYHAVAVFEPGERMSVYVDGTLVSENDSVIDSIFDSTAPLQMGKNSSYFFAGTLDEVRVYSRALNNHEVKALYELN